jgi:hypothetical protein
MPRCGHIGRPELDGDLVASYVGDGAPALVRRALADTDDEVLLARLWNIFSATIASTSSTTLRSMLGFREVLSGLAQPS